MPKVRERLRIDRRRPCNVREWLPKVRERMANARERLPIDAGRLCNVRERVYGFMVQWATDTADATTYSATIPCHAASYTLPGQASGATLHFRIAAIDPSQATHMSAWGAWVAGTAR
jgi:hypothetical protein